MTLLNVTIFQLLLTVQAGALRRVAGRTGLAVSRGEICRPDLL